MEFLSLSQAARLILNTWLKSGKLEISLDENKQQQIRKKDLFPLLQSPNETLVNEYEKLLKRHEELCINMGKIEIQKEQLEQRFLLLPTEEQWEHAINRIQDLTSENQALRSQFDTRPLTSNLVHTHVELYELKAKLKQLTEENNLLKSQVNSKGKKLTDRLKFLFNEKGTP